MILITEYIDVKNCEKMNTGEMWNFVYLTYNDIRYLKLLHLNTQIFTLYILYRTIHRIL